jgi:transcriptional regulator GlxA family with amidase domain
MSRHIAFLVFPGVQLLDLSGPLAAFQVAALRTDVEPAPAYTWEVFSEQGGLVPSSCGVPISCGSIPPQIPTHIDTLIVSGGSGVGVARESAVLRAFIAAVPQFARRVASVCNGALMLAGAGLLEGRRATTHWRIGPQLQREHPQTRVDSDCIFVHDGQIWTSAGVTTGIDLALAMIEEDLGVEAARTTARELIVYHRRPGGQSQFSTLLEMEPASDRIQMALRHAREHLRENLSVEKLAEVACLSPRQFGRSFLTETGSTPAKAVERLRAEAARPRVEEGSEPIEVIARDVGFSDPERMRRAFVRVFGQPPQSLRRSNRAKT